MIRCFSVVLAAAIAACASPLLAQQSTAIHLWTKGQIAFGIFVPNEDKARVAAYENPLYDFLFLNLEPRYDAAAIKATVEGMREAHISVRKTLIVRIPPIERDGRDATQARIAEAFGLGADGVTIPHVRSLEEAEQVLSFFRDTGVDIWSPANVKGNKLAMLMIEDPDALARAADIADLKGYSILACGIGSLTQALGGDRAAAEAGNQKILAETKRTKLVNMLTTTTRDVEQRVKQGYLALIAQGSNADEAIARGRAAAGR
jgi:2-keto-3-deoxy-L-rhamnonate aldolase RhmA